MKRKLGTIFMAIGLALVIGAAGLFAYNRYEEANAAREAEAMGNAVMTQIAERVEAAPEPSPDETDMVTSLEELPAFDIDGTFYVGMLRIPALSLNLPVIHEWSYPNLKIAPCVYSADVENNSLVIAAHNYVSHFGSLKLLTGGEEIIFTDADGLEYHYTVSEVVITQPTDIEGMLDNSWDLTLFTCTYSGNARVTVRCMMNVQ